MEATMDLLNLLLEEDNSRIVLVSMVMFVLLILILVSLFVVLFKLVKSIKENSKEELNREHEEVSYRNKVDDLEEHLSRIGSAIFNLSDTIENHNKNTKEAIENLKELIDQNQCSGCEYGHDLQKEVASVRDEVLGSLKDDVSLLLESDRESIKAFITDKYHYWMELEYIDIYDMKTIEERFKRYLAEDGNTFVGSMVQELQRLPRKCITSNCYTPNMKRDCDSVTIQDHHWSPESMGAEQQDETANPEEG